MIEIELPGGEHYELVTLISCWKNIQPKILKLIDKKLDFLILNVNFNLHGPSKLIT